LSQSEHTTERVGSNGPTAASQPVAAEGPPSVATNWSWGVCWLMFASTALNYMDRQTMSLVGTPIMREFQLNEIGFGWLLSSFLLTYAVCQLPAGYLVDRWDVRTTYAGAVAWWSLAGIAAAFSPSLAVLIVFRIMLGVGESFNWPCALRATAQVLPPSDRSLGNGIFNSGAAVGAVMTPYLVTPLTEAFGWRTSFVVVGLLGFIWVAVWLKVLGSREGRARMTGTGARLRPEAADGAHDRRLPKEVRLGFGAVATSAVLVALLAFRFGAPAIWWSIAWLMFGSLLAARLIPLKSLSGADWAASLGEVVRLRRFWVLVLVSVSINVCWHCLVNWLPTYLKVDRKMTFLASGLWSSVPFIAADLGNLGGGALSRLFATRGLPLIRARVSVMAGCTFLITSGAWVGLVKSNAVVILLLAIMAMATAAFMANYFEFTQEVSTRHTGLIVGILGGLGNLAAAGFIPLAGWIKVKTGGFGPVFVLIGLFPFVGLGALLLGWGKPSASAGLVPNSD
jgi:ACS family hexuronate transporter-like MFS transporter